MKYRHHAASATVMVAVKSHMMLDPELQEQVASLTRAERAKVARNLERWSQQLRGRSAKKPARPQPSEQDSDWVMANYYVNIGLTHHQRALLKKWATLCGFREQPCAEAVRMLAMIGLANLPLIEERWKVHADYCLKEDLWLTQYLDRLAEQSLSELGVCGKR